MQQISSKKFAGSEFSKTFAVRPRKWSATMLILECPYCGVKAEETELSPGYEAHLKRFGPGSSPEEFEAYMFARKNPKGVHFERWRHAYGCGKWFLAARCTATLEVFGTYPAQSRTAGRDHREDQGQGGRTGRASNEHAAFQGRSSDRPHRRRPSPSTASVCRGYPGDTLAAALLANDQMLVGRSFKYHRPRGIVASGAEEPNALVNMGQGGRFEPNQRTTTTELFDGLTCEQRRTTGRAWSSTWAWSTTMPRASCRRGSTTRPSSIPRFAWKHVFEPIVRQSAGLGKAPTERMPTATNRPMPFAMCWSWAAGLPGCRPL
jgi:sarcosine oxidase subunit delta